MFKCSTQFQFTESWVMDEHKQKLSVLLETFKKSSEEFENSFDGMEEWKDSFLKKQFSAAIKSQFVMVYSKLMTRYVN